MQLNISEKDIKNIIHAVKNCPTIEAHKREEILNPIREQLENHHIWNEYDEQKKVKRWA